MGSIGNTPRLAAFQSNVFAAGLDLGRSEINRDLGVYVAAAGATWNAGMLVSRDAAGAIVRADAEDPFGVAKWDRNTATEGTNVDEQVTFTGSASTVNLAKPNVSQVAVRSAADQGGTLFTVTTDYTVNAANGTITHVALGSIGITDTVFVSYSFTLSTADLDVQGRNFFNTTDDTQFAENRITVITGQALLFTTQYDKSLSYTTTGTGSNLYAGGTTAGLEGLFTNDAAEGRFVGKVFQLPTAADPYMGVHFFGGLEEQT